MQHVQLPAGYMHATHAPATTQSDAMAMTAGKVACQVAVSVATVQQMLANDQSSRILPNEQFYAAQRLLVPT